MRGEHTDPSATMRLRPLRPEDAAAIAVLCDDFEVTRMTGRLPHPYGLDEARAFLARRDPAETARAIETAADGLAGVIGWRRGDDATAEFGYWLGRPFWGRGLASRAGEAALALAFADPTLGALRGVVFHDNPASARVLEKLGFARRGVGEGGSLARGEGCWPTWLYTLRREEWEARG